MQEVQSQEFFHPRQTVQKEEGVRCATLLLTVCKRADVQVASTGLFEHVLLAEKMFSWLMLRKNLRLLNVD